MGAMGAIAPTAKKLWEGRSVGASPPNEFCYIAVVHSQMAHGYSKNYKCVIMKVKRCAEFSLKMHLKRLNRWGAYSAPQAL